MSGKGWNQASSSEDENEVEVEKSSAPLEGNQSSAPVPNANTYPDRNKPRPYYHRATDGFFGFMMNINFSVAQPDIDGFLHDHHCRVKDIVMITIGGRFDGKAKIQFEDEESLKIFLALNETKAFDGRIVTKELGGR
jgi:hypothetical protein